MKKRYLKTVQNRGTGTENKVKTEGQALNKNRGTGTETEKNLKNSKKLLLWPGTGTSDCPYGLGQARLIAETEKKPQKFKKIALMAWDRHV